MSSFFHLSFLWVYSSYLLVTGVARVVFSSQLFTSTFSALSLLGNLVEIFLVSDSVNSAAILLCSAGSYRMAMKVLGSRVSVVSFLLQHVGLLKPFLGTQLVCLGDYFWEARAV
jgi:hypothetical protein